MTLSMAGRIDLCLLLAYRTPVRSVVGLLPPGLELATRDAWAFWNVVACHVERMRPAGAPRWAGVSYSHVAYRLYVRSKAAGGVPVEGLYFVRSEADSRLVSAAGNLLTDFRFRPAEVALAEAGGGVALDVKSADAGGDARLRVAPDPSPALAEGSPFATLAEARAFLKYRPLGLSTAKAGRRLKFAEVFRDESRWQESAVRVEEERWAFFDPPRDGVALELATQVAPIDYRWRLGRTEELKPA